MNHCLKFSDLIHDQSSNDIGAYLDEALAFKQGQTGGSMIGKTAVLIFEKPSLRTKLSFTLAVERLGGRAIYFSPQEVGLGTRESASDVAKVVSRMADMAIVRTFEQQKLEEFAASSTIPVINALSDAEHPCQALADVLTMRERKGERFDDGDLNVVYVGDGNNVAVSLAWAVVMSGNSFTISAPEGFGMPQDDIQSISEHVHEQPVLELALEDADVVYTDAWISMGQEDERASKLEKFKGYQVTPNLMEIAANDAIFMHPLPAHKGEEIDAEMLEHPSSVCFDQAENRMWAQMAIIDYLASKNI